jgi:hypothetical protein
VEPLAEARGKPSVFLFHEWFSAAWEWRKLDSSLLVICAYDEERLVGVLPLVLQPADSRGFGIRRAELLTVPDTQLCDLLVAPAYANVVPEALATELLRQRARWDLLRLDYLANDAIAANAFREALEWLGLRSELRCRGRNLAIALDTSWADYYGAVAQSQKANNSPPIGSGKGEVASRDRSDAEHTALKPQSRLSSRYRREAGSSKPVPRRSPGPGLHPETPDLAARRGWLS